MTGRYECSENLPDDRLESLSHYVTGSFIQKNSNTDFLYMYENRDLNIAKSKKLERYIREIFEIFTHLFDEHFVRQSK